jgi:hypothetical protein
MTLVMERALGQFFQRDNLFQNARRVREDADRRKELARAAAPASPAPSSTRSGEPRSTSSTSEAASGTTSAAAGLAKGTPPSPSTTRAVVAQ